MAAPLFGNIINLLPAPSSPPSANDAVAALKYHKEVMITHGNVYNSCVSTLLIL
jgi:hypothetical protein